MPCAAKATNYDGLGNHGWTLDPPRLTLTSDRGTGDARSPRTAFDPRHLDQTNVVFCDGHAEPMKPHTLGYRVRMDGACADAGAKAADPVDPPSSQLFSGISPDSDPADLPAT